MIVKFTELREIKRKNFVCRFPCNFCIRQAFIFVLFSGCLAKFLWSPHWGIIDFLCILHTCPGPLKYLRYMYTQKWGKNWIFNCQSMLKKVKWITNLLPYLPSSKIIPEFLEFFNSKSSRVIQISHGDHTPTYTDIKLITFHTFRK